MKFRALVPWCAAIVLFSSPARMAESRPAATGTITGRVLNRTNNEYVSRAEVRVEGTSLVAVTESDGTYRLSPVPAGEVALSVNYIGATTERATVYVEAGRIATRDFELTSATDKRPAGDILKLGAFVVSSEREGNAKAIMEQRNSMNVTNSVSSDYFGDVAEGNVGEFLKNMPGVDIEYVGPDSRGPRLRGLDPQYIGVSVDGFKLASGDASQGAADGARSFSFDQVSVNSIDRIEVNYTTSADQDANAPAGTINLKTKRAFERRGRRISWQVNLMANGDDLSPGPSYGPADKKTYKYRPGGILEYSDQFLNNRLGVVLNLSESNQYALQWRLNYTYNTAPTTADPRPRAITGIAFLQQPKFSERFTPTLTVDFKATDNLVLSLSAMYNWYDTVFDGRTANFTVANRASVTGDGMTSFNFNNASLALSQNHSHKYVRTRTVSPKFEYRHGDLLVDGAFNYSISTNQYEGLIRTGPVNTPTNALTGLALQLRRSGMRENDWTLVQTGGRDFAELGGFTNPRCERRSAVRRGRNLSGPGQRAADDELARADLVQDRGQGDGGVSPLSQSQRGAHLPVQRTGRRRDGQLRPGGISGLSLGAGAWRQCVVDLGPTADVSQSDVSGRALSRTTGAVHRPLDAGEFLHRVHCERRLHQGAVSRRVCDGQHETAAADVAGRTALGGHLFRDPRVQRALRGRSPGGGLCGGRGKRPRDDPAGPGLPVHEPAKDHARQRVRQPVPVRECEVQFHAEPSGTLRVQPDDLATGVQQHRRRVGVQRDRAECRRAESESAAGALEELHRAARVLLRARG
jgi:hypothetical protein